MVNIYNVFFKSQEGSEFQLAGKVSDSCIRDLSIDMIIKSYHKEWIP